jgi:chromosome segregation ATPase
VTPEQEAKLDKLTSICIGVANQLNELDARVRFCEAELKMTDEDTKGLASRVRGIEGRLDDLTTKADDAKSAIVSLTNALEFQKREVREHRQSIHDLQAEEERRAPRAARGE